MAASVPRRPLPARIYVYVGVVVVVAVLLLPVSRSASGSARGAVAVFEATLLAILIAAAHRRPVEIGPKRKLNAGTVPEVAAVLLLPGPLAVLTLAAGTLAGEAPLRVRPVQRVFNTAVAMVRAALGASLGAGAERLGPPALADVATAFVAPTAMYLCTIVLIRGIVAVQLREQPVRRAALPPQDLVMAEAALSATGVLAALAAANHAWALLVLLAPAVLADRAVRSVVALRDQTRMAEDARSQAEAALAARDDFLSLASHELRTPLTALTGNLQLLQRRLARRRDTPELEPLVTQSGRQVERLTRLVSSLLDVSRMGTGGVELEPEPVAVGPLLERVVEMQRTSTQPPRCIELSLPEPTPVIEADADRLEQVIVNLVENACKYSPPEAPVHVAVEAVADTVKIAVRDEGIGIPASEQARIFGRFRRGSNIDAGIAGLGLGLYIVEVLVRAHGGQLACVSAPGMGSTFTVTLPHNQVVPDEVG